VVSLRNLGGDEEAGMREMEVAIYARVSSARQAEEGTIESQLEALRARVKADGAEKGVNGHET